jgi:hypothetical protein
LDIQWSDCVRANNLDQELLIKMRKAGAVRLVIGLESASPRLLEYINKRVTREQVAQVFRWAHEAGIMTSVEIIAGFPTETDDDIRATLDFLEQNRDYIDEAYLNPFYLERNSLMFRYPQRYGIENIRTERTFETSRGTILGHSNASYMFDEIGGARWSAKSAQILKSIQTMHQAIITLGIWPADDYDSCLSALFYLHSISSDDIEVRKMYSAYLSKIRSPSLFSVPRITRALEDLRSCTSMHECFAIIGQVLSRVLGAVNTEFKGLKRSEPDVV